MSGYNISVRARRGLYASNFNSWVELSLWIYPISSDQYLLLKKKEDLLTTLYLIKCLQNVLDTSILAYFKGKSFVSVSLWKDSCHDEDPFATFINPNQRQDLHNFKNLLNFVNIILFSWCSRQWAGGRVDRWLQRLQQNHHDPASKPSSFEASKSIATFARYLLVFNRSKEY